MSRKVHIRERKLTNKLTIRQNIYLNGASTPTVLNMSRKVHIRERKLTNKLTIRQNIYLNGAQLYRRKTKTTTLLFYKVGMNIGPQD